MYKRIMKYLPIFILVFLMASCANGNIVKDEASIEGCAYIGDIKVENIPGEKFDSYVLRQAKLKGGNTVYEGDQFEMILWHGPGGTAGNRINATVKAYLCRN